MVFDLNLARAFSSFPLERIALRNTCKGFLRRLRGKSDCPLRYTSGSSNELKLCEISERIIIINAQFACTRTLSSSPLFDVTSTSSSAVLVTHLCRREQYNLLGSERIFRTQTFSRPALERKTRKETNRLAPFTINTIGGIRLAYE